MHFPWCIFKKFFLDKDSEIIIQCLLSFLQGRIFFTCFIDFHCEPTFSRDSPLCSTFSSLSCLTLLQGTFPTQASDPCLLCLLCWQAGSFLLVLLKVGSISLLQQTFPIQESNQGLLHCRWILYELSYQRSPISCSVMSNSVTPWTVASQAPLSMDFFRQEYWSELPYQGNLPKPGIEPTSPMAPSL